MSTLNDFMGDDGHGNCVGCLQPIDRITPDCPVCLAVIETLGEWSGEGVNPRVADERLRVAVDQAMGHRS